ncbi:uncharacterized protein LOC117329384 [Pecten maximus]|uniref:uncharacterized protein LOC117329384 n=1 Tax=Pecten maximus TaxID=6579 RepID=UPI001458915F|nr:uncharacterized protein LOC117329384 [Pecten maximus]
MTHSEDPKDIQDIDNEAKMSSLMLLLLVIFPFSQSDHRIITKHPCISAYEITSILTCQNELQAESLYTLNEVCCECLLNVTDCYIPGCTPTDGNSRAVLVINRVSPEPAIHVNAQKRNITTQNEVSIFSADIAPAS